MQIYNLLKYSDNYSIKSGSLWNNHRDKVNDDVNESNDAGNYKKNKKTKTSKPFEYQTKIIGCTSADNSSLEAKVVVIKLFE